MININKASNFKKYYCFLLSCFILILYLPIIKPPSNGHLKTAEFVLYSEVKSMQIIYVLGFKKVFAIQSVYYGGFTVFVCFATIVKSDLIFFLFVCCIFTYALSMNLIFKDSLPHSQIMIFDTSSKYD